MNDKIKDGGPAFPRNPRSGIYEGEYDGMTLRDYFAAKAMQALLSHHGAYEEDARFCSKKEALEREFALPNDVLGEYAYGVADAMLKEREVKAQDATGTLMERIAALETQKKSFADLSFRQVGKLQSLIKELEAERDSLQGLLDEAEKQEPTAWLEKAATTGEWFLAYSKNTDAETKPLYLKSPFGATLQPVNERLLGTLKRFKRACNRHTKLACQMAVRNSRIDPSVVVAALNEFSAVEKEAESVIAAAESALKAEDDKP